MASLVVVGRMCDAMMLFFIQRLSKCVVCVVLCVWLVLLRSVKCKAMLYFKNV